MFGRRPGRQCGPAVQPTVDSASRLTLNGSGVDLAWMSTANSGCRCRRRCRCREDAASAPRLSAGRSTSRSAAHSANIASAKGLLILALFALAIGAPGTLLGIGPITWGWVTAGVGSCSSPPRSCTSPPAPGTAVTSATETAKSRPSPEEYQRIEDGSLAAKPEPRRPENAASEQAWGTDAAEHDCLTGPSKATTQQWPILQSGRRGRSRRSPRIGPRIGAYRAKTRFDASGSTRPSRGASMKDTRSARQWSAVVLQLVMLAAKRLRAAPSLGRGGPCFTVSLVQIRSRRARRQVVGEVPSRFLETGDDADAPHSSCNGPTSTHHLRGSCLLPSTQRPHGMKPGVQSPGWNFTGPDHGQSGQSSHERNDLVPEDVYQCRTCRRAPGPDGSLRRRRADNRA